MPRLPTLTRLLFFLVGLLLACGAIAFLGPRLLHTMNPAHLAAAEDVIGQIWWPATGLRLLVYALLAWGVYPAWVQMRYAAWEATWTVPETAATPVMAEVAETAETPAWTDGKAQAAVAQGRAHFARAAQRQGVVFGGLLLSDLLLVQFPYWLLRG